MADTDTGAAEQPADLRSMLAAAADEVEAKQEPVVPEISEGETGDAGAADTGAAERARGPDGKFVAKDTTEDGEKSPAEPAGEGEAAPAPKKPASETEPQAPAAAAPSAVEAPPHWSAADKQWLAGIPAEHRASVLNRFKQMEAGYTPKLQRLASYERDFQGIPEIFAPHAEALRAQGKIPAHIIQSWAGVEQGLLNAKAAAERGQSDENGAAIVARMIKGYGINPADVARILTSGATEQQQPARTELPPEVVSRLTRLEQAEQERLAQSNQQRLSTAQQQIEAFVSEKDAQGNPKHPFFADVEQHILSLAQVDQAQGKTPDLNDLYDRAVWANPETRTKLRALEKEHAERAAAVERKAKAEAAKRASVSVTGSPGGTSQPQRQSPSGRSLRDTISDAASELESA